MDLLWSHTAPCMISCGPDYAVQTDSIPGTDAPGTSSLCKTGTVVIWTPTTRAQSKKNPIRGDICGPAHMIWSPSSRPRGALTRRCAGWRLRRGETWSQCGPFLWSVYPSRFWARFGVLGPHRWWAAPLTATLRQGLVRPLTPGRQRGLGAAAPAPLTRNPQG